MAEDRKGTPAPITVGSVLRSFLPSVAGVLKLGARPLRVLRRLAVCGLKWAPPWFAALNPLVWWNAVQSVTTLDGLDAPWAGLAQRGARLTVESLFGGTLFLACGRMP